MLVLLVLFVTGCGGSQRSQQAAPSAAASTSAAETGSEAGPDCAELYEGATVTFWVPFSSGGGYDAFARLTAPYIEEQLGATVVVENRPGAGGLLALNSLLTQPADGMTFSLMDGVGAAGATVAGDAGAQFALDELTYLGRLGASPHLVTTGSDSAFETVDDLLTAENFRFGATGPGGADYVNPSVLIPVLDLNAEIVTGFPGASEVDLAVTRGDVDGQTGDFDSRILSIERGDHRPLLVLGRERITELPDTPAVMELDMDEEERAIMEAQLTLLDLGRVVVGPPGMPEAHTTCLHEAIAAATSDPELQEEAAAQSRPINYLSGEELEDLVERIRSAPQSFVEVMEQAYGSS